MNTFSIEIKKCRRAAVLEAMPITGLLGAAYAFLNYAVRKDSLLSLPLEPMVILLTQLYGMIMVLNMFAIIVNTSTFYNMEFSGNALKKMYMLPVKTESLFTSKFLILSLLTALCLIIENSALTIIGLRFLPSGTFEPVTLIKFTIYSYITTMPVLSFMLMISSRCTNIWHTLGAGIIGFFSAMAMNMGKSKLFLFNPFILMMRPAMEHTIEPSLTVLILSILETAFFCLCGWIMARKFKFE